MEKYKSEFEIGKNYRIYYCNNKTDNYFLCDEIWKNVVWGYVDGQLQRKDNKRIIADISIAGNYWQKT